MTLVDYLDDLEARLGVDTHALVSERAVLAGLAPADDRSCGGASRLLRTADEWVAVSLARDSDVALVPAWLECDPTAGADVWDLVAAEVRTRLARDVVDRAALVGLPVARLGEVRAAPLDAQTGLPVTATPVGDRPVSPDIVVVDLSALWAGPLCAHLLGLGGARVIRVESQYRLDPVRESSPAFFDRLHAGHESVVLDLTADDGISALRELIADADVVIEASRPRALEQLGVTAIGVPKVWISITGYGRASNRVAFGDDAAVAGGLVVWDDEHPCFYADAVGDPLAGMTAAAACRRLLALPGAWLLDVAMAQVCAHVAAR